MNGEIDIATGQGIGAVLDDLTRAWHPLLLVDLRPISFLDTTALHLLLRTRSRTLARCGVLRVVSTWPLLPRILVATGLDDHLPLHRSIREALPFSSAESPR